MYSLYECSLTSLLEYPFNQTAFCKYFLNKIQKAYCSTLSVFKINLRWFILKPSQTHENHKTKTQSCITKDN